VAVLGGLPPGFAGKPIGQHESTSPPSAWKRRLPADHRGLNRPLRLRDRLSWAEPMGYIPSSAAAPSGLALDRELAVRLGPGPNQQLPLTEEGSQRTAWVLK